ncbi:glycosyltransferase family 4 protein [Bacillus alkalicellulosilyticus]|uniref:glycosyltransferase family 4 protein n=1 Tax=Alkalihalobacterium alkalicellulosilyticum TaxID=1912214 RepID=UPI000998BEA8|nr:glycosyltransferase family 4 protein [Bacillus alkalicellulosilyticus]
MGATKKMCVVTTTSITIKTFLIDQLLFLSKKGYEITIICDYDKNLEKMLNEEIRYQPVRMKRGMDGFGALKSIWQLYRHFKQERYDIVQYSTPNAAFYASFSSWLARTPVRLYCQWGIRYVGFTGWRRRLCKAIEKMVCEFSTYVEPDSKGNLLFSHDEHLYRSNKSNVVWNGSANGVDFRRFNIKYKETWRKEVRNQYQITEDNIVFGFIGRLTKDKGINELFAAFKSLSEQYSYVRLLLIGPDEQYGIDEELNNWVKLQNSIIHCGFVHDVETYYAALDVLVLPSYREGFGSVVIEAGAMGVPVIVSDIPGPTEAIEKGKSGIVIPKGEIQPLSEAMKAMLCSSRRTSMGEAAVSFVHKHFDQRKLWVHILSDRNRLLTEARFKKGG